mmetsp:Transcript_2518/g.2916  ORF Transcript_2518/g.2916 Transcript_2518/m.2916 type:complete len:220 (-) Transcript_2518:146-805(-)
MNIMHPNRSKENNKSDDINGVVRSVLGDVIGVVENWCLLSAISTDLPRVSFNPNYETPNTSNVSPSVVPPPVITNSRARVMIFLKSSEIHKTKQFELGYDSDGDLPSPNINKYYEEEILPEILPDRVNVYDRVNVDEQEGGRNAESLPESDLSKSDARTMKVDELRKELKQRGLSTSGLKVVLVERLSEGVRNMVRKVVTDNSIESPNKSGNFDTRAYW